MYPGRCDSGEFSISFGQGKPALLQMGKIFPTATDISLLLTQLMQLRKESLKKSGLPGFEPGSFFTFISSFRSLNI